MAMGFGDVDVIPKAHASHKRLGIPPTLFQ